MGATLTETTVLQLTKKLGGLVHDEVTATGTVTMDATYRNIVPIDPGGAARDVLLPAEDLGSDSFYLIVNRADAAETITVKDDSAVTTVATVNQSEAALIHLTAANAWALVAVFTIAIA